MESPRLGALEDLPDGKQATSKVRPQFREQGVAFKNADIACNEKKTEQEDEHQRALVLPSRELIDRRRPIVLAGLENG